MVPVLNHVNTACAVYGNHDFGRSKFLALYTLSYTLDHATG